jgi:3',5'-cyclic-AMP phosphodiesterase
MSLPDEPVIFVVPGDLHLTEAGLDNHLAAIRLIDEVNNVIRPDFVQFIGDNVQDATEDQFRVFRELLGRLEVPHYALVGDHDVKDDPEGRGFHSTVGETFGSSTWRGFRCLRLDTQQARPLGLSTEQLNWFGREVDAALAEGERLVVFQHNYPYQIWENFAGPGIDAWRAIVQTRRVSAIICGHTHYGQVANDGRNVVVAGRSIGDPEGGPPGYLLGYLHGEDLSIAQRSVEDDGPAVLVTHPRDVLFATGPPHVVSGPDEFRVRTWSSSPVVDIRGRTDLGDRFSLDSCGAGEWTAALPGDELAKGEHDFTIEVTVGNGQRGRHSIRFMVDPTGRFTAVPTVRPSVRRTSYC